MLLFPSTAGRINARMPSSGATPEARVFRKRYPGCRQPVVGLISHDAETVRGAYLKILLAVISVIVVLAVLHHGGHGH